MWFKTWVGLLGCVGIVTNFSAAADPLDWLPADVNAVAKINVGDVYKSSLAKKEGWLKQATESFIQQESLVPPGTKQIIVGSELDLSDTLTAIKKYSIIVPEETLTLDKLSMWLPGEIEDVAGKKMAQFGADGYVVDTGDGLWLATTCASRQFITRWLKQGPSGKQKLSPYLTSALQGSGESQFVLAIDLQENFSESEVAETLKSYSWIGSESAAKNVAQVLASAKGITIRLTVDTGRTGTATVDFDRDAAPLKPFLDDLIAEILSRVGASSDDVQGWKWTVAGKQVKGTGTFSPGSARQVISLLEPPSITHAISASSQVTSTTPEGLQPKSSLKYCNSIRVLLDDLRATLNKEKHNHAVYFERYGRKIDDLPKLNVDPALLDFGARVSSSLRYQGQSDRMQKINAGTRKEQTYSSYASRAYYGNVGPYNSGWNSYYSGATSPGVIDAEANQAAKSVRFSEWKQIEDGLVAVRRAMTEKYHLEF
ncbi:hypothetical protein [Schlesneria sp.]|uniref:hypothetical protein n=1 Tax=Schlesneria sp. TaxID=2762018 RepID=UPI002F1FAFCB